MNKKTATLGLIALALGAQAQKITGFSEQSADKQLKLEKQFDAALSAPHIGATLKELSAYPHNLGSPGSKAVAEKILAKFKSYGLEAKLETYQVLMPTPKTRVLEMTGPTKYTALLKELPVKEDATSGQLNQLPTYNAWSADGDVTAKLVFVNYGLPEDYDKLADMGIDVKGKIVISKYGKSWRGIKPKVAYEHGAIGCIIYSDPADDGYAQGDVYPKGAFKNEYGVQRGSVMDMVIYPGDPLTPNVGATPDAKRLDRKDAPTILKIPVLPISYHDAKPLLAALDGPVAPADWRGALPITYHVGPGAAKVHLKLAFNWNMVTAYDVVATIKGSEFPDEWVVRGNHHDGWVNGADDPLSGQSALVEEAKGLGELLKTGWRPKRTIVYCAWDGEEPGLIGSTEFAEDHAKELQEKAVVYINSDDISKGFMSASGSHALETFADEIGNSVIDPETGVTVNERRKARQATAAGGAARGARAGNAAAGESRVNRLGALGSGSDYSSFLQHLGIPTLDFGYGGEGSGGEYHSIFDSYDDFVRFKDPGFVYCAALSKTVGHAVLRLADADVLPFDFRSLAATIERYDKELSDLTNSMRDQTANENKLIADGSYKLAADPAKHLQLPKPKAEVPKVDFTALNTAIEHMKAAAARLNDRWTAATATPGTHKEMNEKLYRAEQQLLSSEGLPRRPWYKHTIYAPGFYTGYGVKTMPGIREAIEQRDWKEAEQQIAIASKSIEGLASYLDKV
jgi:N-acetylated-alpha-linked acidic dipeptidase